jgi:LysM repeat protein
MRSIGVIAGLSTGSTDTATNFPPDGGSLSLSMRKRRAGTLWVPLVSVIAIVALLLTACTRERPTPEPTATLTLPAEPVNATPSGADPAVEQATVTPEGATPGASPSPTSSGSAETYEYQVQQGETLLTIATKFNTDVETVRKLNFLIDDNIFVGQILQVPLIEGMTEAGAPTPTPEPYRYTVATGDTLNSISLRFDVSTVAIIEANGLLDPNSLVVGQEIIIPGYQPQARNGERCRRDSRRTRCRCGDRRDPCRAARRRLAGDRAQVWR